MRPERIVHIGLGAFFKAHQAWYTERASDREDWGIVAYTGRSAKAAEEMQESNCRYTLVTRFSDHDEFEVISSVVRAESADNLADFIATVANPSTAIVTLTITEAGYQPETALDLSESALGRLTLALVERNRLGGLPLALVPCDNLPENGGVLRAVMLQLAKEKGLDASYLDYLKSLRFVSTSIDRITPKITAADLDLVAERTGRPDGAAVATEPFADWVLEGDFPMGRPKWESVGAKFVDDISPFENRKLWLLNGAHSLIAWSGLLRGYETVDEAMTDEVIRAAVESWWSDARSVLPQEGLELDTYVQALRERFANSRISHRLAQISMESLTKISVRIAPVAEALMAQGIVSSSAVTAVANYLALILDGKRPADARDGLIATALEDAEPELALLGLISQKLAAADSFRDLVMAELSALRRSEIDA